MKEKELREIAKCEICGKPFGHTNLPMFFRIQIERWGLNIDAVTRQQGLTMVLGGSAKLAMVMGPNEDMAEKMFSKEITVCMECATKQICIMQLTEEKK